MPEAVDLWLIPLDRGHTDLADRLRLLSPDERVRAGRFAQARDRDRFIAAHSALRSVLGRYRRRAASSLAFDAGPGGKPALRDADGWHFNLSHAGPRAVLAVCHGREVGVDVEELRPAPLEIADQYFAPDETRRIRSADDPAASFYAHWTMKEAWLKAAGEGLRAPLPALPAPGGRQQIGRFVVMACNVEAGFAGAVAVSCAPDETRPELRYRPWVG